MTTQYKWMSKMLAAALCTFIVCSSGQVQAANDKTVSVSKASQQSMQELPPCFSDDNGVKAKTVNEIFANVEKWSPETKFYPLSFFDTKLSIDQAINCAKQSHLFTWKARLNAQIYHQKIGLDSHNYEIDENLFTCEVLSYKTGTTIKPDGQPLEGVYVTARPHIGNYEIYNPFATRFIPQEHCTVKQKKLTNGNNEFTAASSAYIESPESIDVKISKSHMKSVQQAADALAAAAVKAKLCSKKNRDAFIQTIIDKYRMGGIYNVKGCGVESHKDITIILDKNGNLVDRN